MLMIAGATSSSAIEFAKAGVDDVNVTAELAVALLDEATGALVEAPDSS